MAASFYKSVAPWVSSTDHVRIRLIELLPPNAKSECAFKQELRCNIFWTDLADPVEFKALSYAWGSGSQTHKILVADHHLNITESLDCAMRHLRHPTKSVILWIDQISINQSDDEEKTEQVGQMGVIYRMAREVLVWLGPAADGSDEVMEVFHHIGRVVSNFGMWQYYQNEQTAQKLMKAIRGVEPEDPDTLKFSEVAAVATRLFSWSVIEAMIAWYGRAWFTRVWVIQEFALARSAVYVCGHKRVASEDVFLTRQIYDGRVAPALVRTCLMSMYSDDSCSLDQQNPLDAFKAMQDSQHNIELCKAAMHDPSAIFNIIRKKAMWLQQGCKQNPLKLYHLLKLIYTKNKMQATEQCDFIYSILSLAHDTHLLGIKVDYSLKRRADLIFARAARAIIAQGDVDILALSQHPKTHCHLPTWVPDWTSKVNSHDAWQTDEKSLFSAGTAENIQIFDVGNDLTLGLVGVSVDTVTEVGLVWQSAVVGTSAILLDQLSDLARMCSAAHGQAKHYSSATRQAEAVWRVPIGDVEQQESGVSCRATTTAGMVYGTILKKLVNSNQGLMHQLQSNDQHGKELDVHYHARMETMTQRRPYLTKKGYVGMAPAQTEPGDIVVVFLGAALPYILRPSADGWTFVGDCYCDGIMDGEALKSVPRNDFMIF